VRPREPSNRSGRPGPGRGGDTVALGERCRHCRGPDGRQRWAHGVLDAPETIERGQLYELDGSDSTGEIAEYRWDYNPNAPTAYQRSSNESTIYARDRTDEGQDQFTVRLGVVDDEGDVTWEETITVTESESPNASIASSDNFTVEREQWERTDGGSWFNSTSTDDQGIRRCEWTFEYGPTVERHTGDGLGWGAGSTECRKNISYAVPGTYNVTLNVTDWAGNSDETTRTVEVVLKEPVTDDPQPNASLTGPDSIEWGSTYWVDASNSTSEDDVRYYIAERPTRTSGRTTSATSATRPTTGRSTTASSTLSTSRSVS